MTPPSLTPAVVHCKRAPFDVYIGRPSKWGNPWSYKAGTLAKYQVATIVAKHREWFLAQPEMVEMAKRRARQEVALAGCTFSLTPAPSLRDSPSPGGSPNSTA